MASYEESAVGVIDDIVGGMTGVSGATLDAITNLIPKDEPDAKITISEYTGGQVAPDTTIVSVADGTNLTSDPGAGKAILMGADTSANVVFGADTTVEVIQVGGGGNSNVVFEGDKTATVELMGGQNDSVSTGGGDDHVTFNGGSATINTGEGNDNVLLKGEGNVQVQGGDGDMVIRLDSTSVAATIDAGDGFDQVTLHDFRHFHKFFFDAATKLFKMHSDTETAMTNVNVVTFDQDGDGVIQAGVDSITVLAQDAKDSVAAKLYQIALGRQAIDSPTGQADWDGPLGGLNFWMTEFEKGQTDGSMEHMVKSFLNCDEFHHLYDGKSNAEYVADLFTNLNAGAETAATIVNGQTAEQFVAALDSGMIDRYDVAFQMAQSAEAVQILGVNGQQYVIDGFEGGMA